MKLEAGSGEPASDSCWAILWPKGIVGLATVDGRVLGALGDRDLDRAGTAGPVRIRCPKLHRIDPPIPQTSPLGSQQDMVARLEGIRPRVPIAQAMGSRFELLKSRPVTVSHGTRLFSHLDRLAL